MIECVPVRRFPILAWSIAGLLVLAGNARAQETTPAGAAHTSIPARQGDADAGAELEELLGVEIQSVFGASRFLQKITEAPTAVSIVTADEIARYGWRTLGDVLRSVRGFYVTDDRSWAYVGLRGFQRTGDYNTRVLLLVDGHRTNDNIYDQALVQEDFLVDLGEIERIEIIRGPSSSLYGSNAFFGVINVVTRGASPERAPTMSVDLGTLGLRTERVSIGRRFTSDLAVHLSASLQRRAGLREFYTPEFDDGAPGAGTAQGLDYTERRNVFVKAKYRRVDLSAGYNRRKRGVPTGAYDVVPNHPDTWVIDRHGFAGARWEGAVGGRWELEARGSYDNYEYLGSYPYFTEGTGSGVSRNLDLGQGQWLTGGLQLSRRFPAHRLTVGVERRQHLEERMVNYYEGEAPLLDVSRRSSTSAAYVQDEWRLLPSLLINAGLRYDRYAAFRDPVKPRGALVYQPAKRTAVKLLYGAAFRAPNVFETAYEYPGSYLPNPRLSPEETRTVEALVEHYAGTRARLTASWFHYNVSDLIDQRFDEAQGASIYDNVAAVAATGYEAEAEWKWPGGAQVLGSYTHSRVRNTMTAERLSNAPAHVVQLRAAAPLWAKTFLALDLHGLSGRWTPRGTQVGAYVVPNITWSRTPRNKGLGFALTIANLSNTSYADPVSTDFDQAAVTQDGRTARLRLSWTF